MQTLVAAHRDSERHPLFDESSDYGRMHANTRVDLKMMGYFCLLWSRAEKADVAIPKTSPRSEQDLRALTRDLDPTESPFRPFPSPSGMIVTKLSGDNVRLVIKEPTIRVLDALRRTAQVIVTGSSDVHTQTEVPVEICLVGEANGSQSVGLLLRDSPPVDALHRGRAFFLMPGAIRRIEQALSGAAHLDAFAPDVLRQNLDVAMILCAAAELEGERSDGGVVHFARLPVPDHNPPCLPPGIGEARIVVVLHADDTPLPATGN